MNSCQSQGKSVADLKNGVKQAKGGARPGAGRKPSATTILSRLAIAELDEEAEKSVRFLVEVRDNEEHPIGVRVECARDLIDRRFGKSKQAVEHSGGLTLEQLVGQASQGTQ